MKSRRKLAQAELDKGCRQAYAMMRGEVPKSALHEKDDFGYKVDHLDTSVLPEPVAQAMEAMARVRQYEIWASARKESWHRAVVAQEARQSAVSTRPSPITTVHPVPPFAADHGRPRSKSHTSSPLDGPSRTITKDAVSWNNNSAPSSATHSPIVGNQASSGWSRPAPNRYSNPTFRRNSQDQPEGFRRGGQPSTAGSHSLPRKPPAPGYRSDPPRRQDTVYRDDREEGEVSSSGSSSRRPSFDVRRPPQRPVAPLAPVRPNTASAVTASPTRNKPLSPQQVPTTNVPSKAGAGAGAGPASAALARFEAARATPLSNANPTATNPATANPAATAVVAAAKPAHSSYPDPRLANSTEAAEPVVVAPATAAMAAFRGTKGLGSVIDPSTGAAAVTATAPSTSSTPLVSPVVEDPSGVPPGPLAASKNAIEPSRDPRRRAR